MIVDVKTGRQHFEHFVIGSKASKIAFISPGEIERVKSLWVVVFNGEFFDGDERISA